MGQRWKVKGQGHSLVQVCGSKDIQVDVLALNSIFSFYIFVESTFDGGFMLLLAATDSSDECSLDGRVVVDRVYGALSRRSDKTDQTRFIWSDSFAICSAVHRRRNVCTWHDHQSTTVSLFRLSSSSLFTLKMLSAVVCFASVICCSFNASFIAVVLQSIYHTLFIFLFCYFAAFYGNEWRLILCKFFRSTFLCRPNKVGFKCLSVLLSTKRFFDFSENLARR